MQRQRTASARRVTPRRALLVRVAVVIASAGLAAANAQPLRPTEPSPSIVVVARYTDDASIQRVAARFGHLIVDREQGFIVVETDAFGRAQLEKAGFTTRIDIEASKAINVRRPLGKSLDPKIGGLTCYRTVEETEASMLALAQAHPDLVELRSIGESWRLTQGLSGFPIRVVRVTNRTVPGPKPKLFVMASVHAREYAPAEVLTRFVERLVGGYGSDADATWMLDHFELHALLQANPDGRKLAEAQWSSTAAGQRKNANASVCAATRLGVDLNRNYPFGWNSAAGGSSGDPCSDTFRGAFGNSEPETSAVVAYLRGEFPAARGPAITDAAPDTTPGMFIDLHSFSRLVLWPWGNIATPAPNGAALQTLGRRLAWFNGYTPQQSPGLYLTDGTTVDFAYGDRGIAAFTFELGTAFFESCGSFENIIVPDNLKALTFALRTARRPYLEPAGPESFDVAISPDLVTIGEPATLTATVDDARFSTISAPPNPVIQPQHAIVGADAYVGAPPWEAGVVALPLAATDGAFNQPREAVTAAIPTAGLAPGRHLVFVRGRDANAVTTLANGPTAAAFMRVIAAAERAWLRGRVSDPAGAPVAATLSIDGLVAKSSAASGDYLRPLAAGSFALEVRADGFEPATISPLVLTAGATLTRDVTLFRYCPRLDEQGEIGAPTTFLAQSPWTRAGVSGASGGAWIAATGSGYPANQNATLTSSELDLSADAVVLLSFDQRCATQARFDFGIVEVRSTPSAEWTEVMRCEGDPDWRRITLPLPQLTGAAAAQVRFRFTSNATTSAAGYALDNIALEASGPACRASQASGVVFADSFEQP